MTKITRTESTIRIQSPYSPDLPAGAKQLSGRWDRAASEWVFPLQAEAEVKSLYLDIYGEWDDQPQKTVILMCYNGNDEEPCGSITLGGRVIARAYGRDSGAKTADGVILITGRFDSGGSRKNWETQAKNVTFKLLDVPVKKAQELVENPEWCEKIEIIETEKTAVDRDALIDERTRLAARITEIDAILHQE